MEQKIAAKETVEVTNFMKDGTPVATVLGGKCEGSQVLLEGHQAKKGYKFEVETFRNSEGMYAARNIRPSKDSNRK